MTHSFPTRRSPDLGRCYGGASRARRTAPKPVSAPVATTVAGSETHARRSSSWSCAAPHDAERHTQQQRQCQRPGKPFAAWSVPLTPSRRRFRSDERRVGKAWVRTGRSRWSLVQYKKITNQELEI